MKLSTLLFTFTLIWNAGAQEALPENFIDVQPLDEGLLVLSGTENECTIALRNENGTMSQMSIALNHPKGIFVDCMGFINVLAQDSSYQIEYSDSALNLVATVGWMEFNDYLLPCVGYFDGRVAFQSYNAGTGSYELTYYKEAEGKTMYTCQTPGYASEKMEISRTGRNESVGSDFNRALSSQNRTMNEESQRANIRYVEYGEDEAPNPGYNFSQVPSQYGTEDNNATYSGSRVKRYYVTGAPQAVGITAKQLGNFLVLVNDNVDSVIVLDHQGYTISRQSLEQGGDDLDVFKDIAASKLYIGMKEQSLYILYELDPFKGTMELVKTVSFSPEKRNARIYNGTMYTVEKVDEAFVLNELSL